MYRPLSPYLFVLSVKMLAKAIQENTSIKGIFVNNREINLSQYADDTTLILDGTKESLITIIGLTLAIATKQKKLHRFLHRGKPNQTMMVSNGFADFPCSNRGAKLVELKRKKLL